MSKALGAESAASQFTEWDSSKANTRQHMQMSRCHTPKNLYISDSRPVFYNKNKDAQVWRHRKKIAVIISLFVTLQPGRVLTPGCRILSYYPTVVSTACQTRQCVPCPAPWFCNTITLPIAISYTRVSAFGMSNNNKLVRPRWPYDMRPSVRAEKYMCVIVIR